MNEKFTKTTINQVKYCTSINFKFINFLLKYHFVTKTGLHEVEFGCSTPNAC